MDINKFLDWMEKNNLYTIVKNHAVYFKNILLNSLGVKNEEVLIIGDFGDYNKRVSPILCGGYLIAAKKLGLKVNFATQESEIGNKDIVEALLKQKEKSVIILNLSNKLGKVNPPLKNSYRRYCKLQKHRFISMSGLGGLETRDVYLITRALDIDYKKLKGECNRLKKYLDAGREIKITTDKGTNLTANITGQKAIAITGDYKKHGTGGNMPAGEVYIAPNLNSVDGVVVVDGSSRHKDGTSIIEKPIHLTMRKGRIIKIIGGREAKMLISTLKWAMQHTNMPTDVMKIGEIGIGLNPKINIIGAMVVDEKAKNTAHIGIGGNSWFGGDIFTLIHLDQVFRNPTISVDGRILT